MMSSYTRRDWRNRNRIKTPIGSAWLTIPVNTKGRFHDPIKKITVTNPSWGVRHWKTITANYARAPLFQEYAGVFERLYVDGRDTRLSAINFNWIRAICGILGICTKLSWSMDYELVERQNGAARRHLPAGGRDDLRVGAVGSKLHRP